MRLASRRSKRGRRRVVLELYLGMGQTPGHWPMVERANPVWARARGVRAYCRPKQKTNHPLVRLEGGELADLPRKEAALVFTSVMSSNETRHLDLVKFDSDCRPESFLGCVEPQFDDRGVRQSGVRKANLHHRTNADHLEELLKAAEPGRPKLIVKIRNAGYIIAGWLRVLSHQPYL